ncbi:hypothetical protein HII31_07642 [Pseudocercospora fuligena]|uniref:Uncharacterized protein n=1 Tax=Pseudocercospora fuligena TaxID=685502 RepID=A0A8H6RHJ0_9PEZI|nr:hypothetical protein HII31_07642 [Pseudocercospora fuligena]
MSSQNNNQVPAPYTEGGINDLLTTIEETESLPDEDTTMAAQGQDDSPAAPLPDENITMAAQGQDDAAAATLPADPLRDGIHEELQKLLVASEPNVRNGLAMRFALNLLIQLFREMKDDEEVVLDKDKWLSQIATTIHDKPADDTIRYKTGAVIIDALVQAPWGLRKGPDSPAYDTTLTLNSIFEGMCSFARTLTTQLRQKELEGVNLADYDVDENKSDAEDDADLEEDTTTPAATAKKPARQSSGRNAGSGDGRGNHGHSRARLWTDEEHLCLLRCWRANVALPHAKKVEAHNETFPRAAGDTHMRTREGCRQQMDKIVGLTPSGLYGRIDAKIDELEKKIVAEALAKLSQ